METIVWEKFTWPLKEQELPTNSPKALKTALKLVGGNENDWECYVILDDILQPVEKLYKVGDYIIKLRTDIPFIWPEKNGNAVHWHKKVIREALRISKMNPRLWEFYFIAGSPGERSLQYTSNGILRGGTEYYLRASI